MTDPTAPIESADRDARVGVMSESPNASRLHARVPPSESSSLRSRSKLHRSTENRETPLLDPLREALTAGRLVRLALLLLLAVDSLVRRPQGFTWLRRLVGVPLGGSPSSPCGWDMEGAWRIGIVDGGETARPPWEWDAAGADADGGPSLASVARRGTPAVTCADLGADPPASFVADPFLVRGPDSWFLFYEYKNLARLTGEIGVSESSDGGRTWKFRGTALSEPFHLSYPFVHYDDEGRGAYQMIPETNQAEDVRIYETTPENFPFGWVHVSTPLRGVRCVDTAAVRHEGRLWIFTSELPSKYAPFAERKSTLRLYHAERLSDPWVEHPRSPIVTGDRRIGRSAGPPVVHGDTVYRFAQEGTNYYGEGVHVLRIHVLTPALYEEQRVRFIAPRDLGGTVARFHHLDARQEEDGTWLAAFDLDEKGENEEYFEREGWLFYTKRVALICLAVHALWDVLVVLRRRSRLLHDLGLCARCSLKRVLRVCVDAAEAQRGRAAKLGGVRSKLLIALKFGSIVACSFVLALASTDMISQCTERDSLPTDQCFNRELASQEFSKTMSRQEEPRPNDNGIAPLSKSLSLSNGTQTLAVVTAASPGFMENMRNFVGSVHYWEPSVEIDIYDLGLTDSDLYEVAQWKRVKVVPFRFEKYPPHVALLYNFAWKTIVLNEAIERHPRMIYLDSGMEIRRPLTDVRHFLEKDGYYGIQLQGGNHLIGRQTHPGTYAALKKRGVEFDADEISKRPFCAGGVAGLVRGRVESMLGPALDCALDRDCISPTGSGRNNHDYDQSVISVVAHATGRGGCCHAENIVDWEPIGYTMDETRCNDVLMGTRRWRKPKAYEKHIDRHVEVREPPERKKGVLALESSQTGMFKPQSNSKWQQCISVCDKKKGTKEWGVCTKDCPADHGKEGVVFINFVAEFDYLWYRIRKGVHCRAILCRTFYLVLFSCSVLFLFSHGDGKNVSSKNT